MNINYAALWTCVYWHEHVLNEKQKSYYLKVVYVCDKWIQHATTQSPFLKTEGDILVYYTFYMGMVEGWGELYIIKDK